MRQVLICGSRCAGVAALALALASCAGKAVEPEVRTVQVKVPTPTPCLPANFRDPPAQPDTDKALRAAPSGAERYQMIAAGRIADRQWIGEIKPFLAACRQPSP